METQISITEFMINANGADDQLWFGLGIEPGDTLVFETHLL